MTDRSKSPIRFSLTPYPLDNIVGETRTRGQRRFNRIPNEPTEVSIQDKVNHNGCCIEEKDVYTSTRVTSHSTLEFSNYIFSTHHKIVGWYFSGFDL